MGIKPLFEYADGDAEGIGERGGQGSEEPRIEISDRQQIEHLHRVSTGRLQPYFSAYDAE